MYAAKHAALHPDRPAIIMATSGEVVTYAAYEAGANQVAHFLRESGVRRRDHVAIFMDNEPLMLVAEGGAERSGAFFTCINSYLSTEEVAYIINDAQAKIVLTAASKADVAQRLPGLCPNVERWVMVQGAPGGPFEEWREAIDRQPADPID